MFPGAGSWSSLSDSSKKQNIKKIPISSALSKINNINVYEWNYKSQDTSVKHVGPMAQDFHKAFGLGNSNLAITSVDMDGVILLGVQGVNNRLDSMYEQLNNTILNSNLNYASISNRLRILESVTKKMEMCFLTCIYRGNVNITVCVDYAITDFLRAHTLIQFEM